jgi:hypothetical protein
MIARLIQDNITDADAALFSGMMDVLVRSDRILEKKNPFAYTSNIITVKAGTTLTLYNAQWKSFRLDADVELSDADLDAGSFEVGKDYYVYLVDDGADGQFIISLNTTFPAGYSSDNSRKIGGFHYGHIRKVSTDGLWVPVDSEGTRFGSGAIDWEDNVTTGIIPNSVWDLQNRPKCSPEGMVKIGHIWVDIYLSSAAESITFEDTTNGLHIATGRLQSKYGQVPVTGTEGMNWYTFGELAGRVDKRLLSYGEWIKAAFGNPQGQDAADGYGWTKTTNSARVRTGCRVNNTTGAYDAATGIKPAAISAFNIVDAVGNVYEWLDELSNRHETTSFAWQDVLGAGKGQAYLPNATGLIAYIAGANWLYGVYAGSRAVCAGNGPWGVYTFIGSRLACDNL